jgi:two-component system sensor histidine kinase HupT/HoxJ
MLLGAMTILLFAVNWRHRVLETLPIARRDVIEQLPEAVILADSDGFVLDVNPAAEKIIGSPAASLRRQSLELLLADLATDRDRQEVERAARALLSCGQTARVEFEAVDDRALELNASAVGSGDGETAGFYALLRDRTEHLRYERFQRQSHRLEIVASLTQGIAYEVNNPLAFVRSNLNHIHRTCGQLAIELRDAPGGKREELEELRQVAEESLEGLQRIEETVGRMRRFSLLHERELTVVDLNAVVNDAVRMGQFHSSPELRVRRELCVVTLPVKGSAEHLVQAVLNLVVNARQALAGRHDGLLRVSTRRTGDGVEVRVADNGPGISEEMQQRIFDPDYAAQGFGPDGGLGLAIAFGIIQEHNGMLDLESSSSLGTEFVIRLPVATGATITAGGGPDPAA